MSGVSAAGALAPTHAQRSFWRRALAHRSFVLGGVLTALLVFAAALSLVWTPWSPYEIDMAAKLQAPVRPPASAPRLTTASSAAAAGDDDWTSF